MALEIERKFLVNSGAFKQEAARQNAYRTGLLVIGTGAYRKGAGGKTIKGSSP